MTDFYLDTDFGGGSNDGSESNPWVSLSSAISGFPTLTEDSTLYCKGLADDSSVAPIITGITGTYALTIEGDVESLKWDDDKYTLIATDHWQDVPNISDDDITFKNIQIDLGSYASGMDIHGTDVTVEMCIIKDGTNANGTSITIADPGSAIIQDTLVYGGAGTAIRPATFGACQFLNCTVSNSGKGFNRTNGAATHVIKNCAVLNCADDITGTFVVSYCASDDGDGSNAQTLSTTRTDDFTDVSTYDFSPTDADSKLVGNGENGVDIGAIAFESANLPINLIQKRRTNHTNLRR